MVMTNKIFARRSILRYVRLKTSKIRITDHFITARRYSTSSTCGRTCLGTGRSSIRVVRDPMKVPKQTMEGKFVEKLRGRGRPVAGYCGYLRGYGPTAIPCYVAGTLVTTIGKSVRGNLMFYNTGINHVGQVAAIRRLVDRLIKT